MAGNTNRISIDLYWTIFSPLVIASIAISAGIFLPVVVSVLKSDGYGLIANLIWCFVVAIIGSFILFLAKLPQYRSGDYWKIGCSHLHRVNRFLYWLSFCLTIPSFFLALLMVLKPIVK
jgi:hypothetical protein